VSEIEEPVSVLPALDAILAQRPDSLALIDSPNKQRVTGQFPRQPTYAKADREISALAAHFVEAELPSHSVVTNQDLVAVIMTP